MMTGAERLFLHAGEQLNRGNLEDFGLRCAGLDNHCCTPEKPCGKNDGDCDIDEDCEHGLMCGEDNCIYKNAYFNAGDDCCIDSMEFVYNYRYRVEKATAHLTVLAARTPSVGVWGCDKAHRNDAIQCDSMWCLINTAAEKWFESWETKVPRIAFLQALRRRLWGPCKTW